MTRRTRRWLRRRLRDEGGSLATSMVSLLLVGVVLAGALVDVGAYLVAAARAQGAADAAALAAVSVEAAPGLAPPRQTAAWTATRNAARLESCACAPGSGRMEVTVSVPVPGVHVPRLAGMQRVTATAEAELVEPADGLPTGLPDPVPPPSPPPGPATPIAPPGPRAP